MDLSDVVKLVEMDEELLFDGCFNEKVIRADLSMRREKRNFYIEAFNKFLDNHRTISTSIEVRLQDASLAERSKKCQNEASRLLDIVYEY